MSRSNSDSSRLGGFPPDRFVAGSVNDNLFCSICRFVFDNPTLTPCGHLFCSSCLKHWLESCQTLLPSCPECRRTVFAFDVRPVRGLRNYISSLPVYCSLKKNGCKSVVPLEKIDIHESNCSHKSAPPPTSSVESSPNARPNRAIASSRLASSSSGTKPNGQTTSSNRSRIAQSSNLNRRTANSSASSTLSRTARANSGAVSVHVNNSSSTRTTSTVGETTRSSARQRILNSSISRPTISSSRHSTSLSDRVTVLEEKLQQVRLDIEAAEQRNIWLETQLTLARNNLSLAEALRRVRTSSGRVAFTPAGRRRSVEQELNYGED